MHNILRKIRRDQGLTQAEIAKMLGVSRSCVANWETGVREADILIIRKYNELFGYKEEILDVFRKIKFPTDDFFPPRSIDNDNSSCCGN